MRRKNLLNQAKAYFGRFDVSTMQNLLAVPIKKGGALVKDTVFQVIMTPKDGMLWARIPGVDNHWQAIDLQSFIAL